jgi:predicted O-methyltransferase YrrM
VARPATAAAGTDSGEEPVMKPVTLPGVEEYAENHTTPDRKPLIRLAAETNDSLTDPQMMSGRVQGRFLQMLVHAVRPRLVVEVGTFSGYAALSMAEVLPPEGRIVTCEIDPRHAEFARRHIAASPYADRITVELGPAADTLRKLDGPFDFVFIDADKTSYLEYYELALEKLAPGGLIAADNALWNGDVLNSDSPDPDTQALRKFNDTVSSDPRVACVLVTIRDGLMLIRRA